MQLYILQHVNFFLEKCINTMGHVCDRIRYKNQLLKGNAITMPMCQNITYQLSNENYLQHKLHQTNYGVFISLTFFFHDWWSWGKVILYVFYWNNNLSKPKNITGQKSTMNPCTQSWNVACVLIMGIMRNLLRCETCFKLVFLEVNI